MHWCQVSVLERKASKHNLIRLVFLRVLDYYTGILFLTTNRAGALDEAFKSRIHYKIYYPALTKEQTMDIWRLNIQRLRQINEQSEEKRPLEIMDSTVLHFAERQFDESSQRKAGQWNGRQIRNAFQVARSLAYYDRYDKEGKEDNSEEPIRPAVLDVKYFHLMHEITENFDHYMLEVYSGMTDGKIAHQMEHRADHYAKPQPYRSAHARDGFDDRYIEYSGRSTFDNGPAQGHFGRPRSTSHQGGRPSLSVPGASQRFSPNPHVSPVSAPYDLEANTDSLGTLEPTPSRFTPRHLYQASEPPASDFRAGTFSDSDYASQGSNMNPRFSSGFGSPSQFRTFERGGNYGSRRDPHGHNGFDADKGYRVDRNEHGKRERS